MAITVPCHTVRCLARRAGVPRSTAHRWLRLLGYLGRPREILEALHRYLARRLARLLDTLREKNVKAYGRLAGLLRALYLLARDLGPLEVSLADVEAAIRA